MPWRVDGDGFPCSGSTAGSAPSVCLLQMRSKLIREKHDAFLFIRPISSCAFDKVMSFTQNSKYLCFARLHLMKFLHLTGIYCQDHGTVVCAECNLVSQCINEFLVNFLWRRFGCCTHWICHTVITIRTWSQGMCETNKFQLQFAN